MTTEERILEMLNEIKTRLKIEDEFSFEFKNLYKIAAVRVDPKPVLYLNREWADGASDNELRFVMEHELLHLKAATFAAPLPMLWTDAYDFLMSLIDDPQVHLANPKIKDMTPEEIYQSIENIIKED